MPASLVRALAQDHSFVAIPEADRARIATYLDLVEVAAGREIVREGGRDRDMFFVLDGTARTRRGGLEISTLGPGSHFGELALLAGHPRAATVVTTGPLVAARLRVQRFEQLAAEDPSLALSFVQALVGALAHQLAEMTDSVGMLLKERSMPRHATVEVRDATGLVRRTRTGTLIGTLLPEAHAGAPVVAGLLDHRPVSLDTPIACDATIAPVTTAHWEGERIRRATLGLVLLEATRRVAPGREVRVGASLGGAQRLEVLPEPGDADAPALAAALEREMRAIVATDARVAHEWWTVEEASSHFERGGWHDAAQLLRTWRAAMVPLVTCGDVLALALGPLLPRTGMVGELACVADGDRLLLVSRRDEPRNAPVPRSDAMTAEHHRWLASLGIASVGAFDMACVRGEVSQIIRVSEGFQEKRIGRIADEIASRRDRVKVICIAGPSSSGKTTFIKRLTVQLQVAGLRPIGISLDDYYVDRDKTVRDENGDLDFEAFEALDAGLLRDQLARVLRGERTRLARYDFKAGKSLPDGGAEIALERGDVLLVEGIHGLNPGLLRDHLRPDQVFRVFVCPLTTLPFDRLSRVAASDLRLLRRIVRDRHARGHGASATIERWPSVRRGERRHIFPYIDRADAVFDSSLVYEPAVLKVYAERYLLEVPQQHPTYATAYRLLQMLSYFVSIYPDHVPPTSILREFIGGSGFEY